MHRFVWPIIENAKKANPPVEGDYVKGDKLYCGLCHTPKQTYISLGEERILVPCLCECKEALLLQEEKDFKETQKAQYRETHKTQGLSMGGIAEMRFENSEYDRQIDYARRYVEAFDRAREENIGLLFWGKTGNGKTFTAGCIANALLDKGVAVLMTSFPRILGALSARTFENRNAFLDAFRHYDLLILDDLGAERESSYALEQVYTVIERRFQTGKPLIVTTNLSLGEMQQGGNRETGRIYDRVLAMCTPVQFAGMSRRTEMAKEKMKRVKELLM